MVLGAQAPGRVGRRPASLRQTRIRSADSGRAQSRPLHLVPQASESPGCEGGCLDTSVNCPRSAAFNERSDTRPGSNPEQLDLRVPPKGVLVSARPESALADSRLAQRNQNCFSEPPLVRPSADIWSPPFLPAAAPSSRKRRMRVSSGGWVLNMREMPSSAKGSIA